MLKTPCQPLFGSESVGSYGSFGIRIEVTGSKLPDLSLEAIRDAAYDAERDIKAAIMATVVKNDPAAQEWARKEKADLLSLFDRPIYVEEIPNGYCSDWCCRHLPWFMVTAPIGHIKIGWRKRVIEIDWSRTQNTKTGEDLFPDENVTKSGRSIHAWSLDDARRYLNVITTPEIQPV